MCFTYFEYFQICWFQLFKKIWAWCSDSNIVHILSFNILLRAVVKELEESIYLFLFLLHSSKWHKLSFEGGFTEVLQ